ncbi:MAG: excalibur calcium-binding domain-containing protein [Gordonia sp. (in: high G+C Gram-positive bacteria)]|uniref:GmrSD restriction endonuclease domain-containing protein n=1 Tax=Gordonia sp. (in: high G+C Gram-positive bacteria) TaxID=84139 RepID=UPI0039E2F7C3
MRIRTLTVAVAVTVGLISAPLSATTPTADAAPTQRNTLALLAGLDVKGRAPMTGYSRDRFGHGWSDDVDVQFGHNGCDTRNDILKRDLSGVKFKPGTRDCVVASGTLKDPYTGATIRFTRGNSTSTAVQIDHVVALADAWQKGAQRLSPQQRRALANDPRNLLAVDGPTNGRKGAGDAATWLPPRKAYRCTYVAKQVQVKAAYRLWVTRAERDAIKRTLEDCGGGRPTERGDGGQAQQRSPQRAVPQQRQQRPQSAPRATYRNCSEARAAGAAPLRRGQPGYSSSLDRDGDGVACE